MEYNYGDIIEYIDCTLDENFDNARRWAQAHNTTFEELMERRDLPKRYFQIGEEYIPPVPPPVPEPTEEEKARALRAQYFETYVDWYQSKPLYWEELSETEKQYRSEYRQYLKDYTKEDKWWEQNPMTYEEWLVATHPVEQ